MSDLDQAILDAEAAASSRLDALAERLAERVGGVANAGAVFGDPVERGGVTVIPVAKVRWGAGGGGGTGVKSRQGGEDTGEGGGGGAGVMASPVGYIEIRDGEARFVRVREPADLVPMTLAAGFGAWLLLRGLRGLFR
jgi:uncharacterized spore protein YtfJ